MPNIFREVSVLRKEGKLHKALLNRVRILFIISLVLMAIVLFNLFFRGTDPLIAGALMIIGFILGLFVFSRMNVVNWNEREEIIQTGRMDIIGYATIGLYILFEIGLRTFLNNVFPLSATAFLLAGIFGTLFGRAMGTIIEIHRVFRLTHPA